MAESGRARVFALSLIHISPENLTVKRPGDGISPMRWYDVLGKTAKRDFAEDEKIEL